MVIAVTLKITFTVVDDNAPKNENIFFFADDIIKIGMFFLMVKTIKWKLIIQQS
jgi:hypothetical protein